MFSHFFFLLILLQDYLRKRVRVYVMCVLLLVMTETTTTIMKSYHKRPEWEPERELSFRLSRLCQIPGEFVLLSALLGLCPAPSPEPRLRVPIAGQHSPALPNPVVKWQKMELERRKTMVRGMSSTNKQQYLAHLNDLLSMLKVFIMSLTNVTYLIFPLFHVKAIHYCESTH